MNYEIDLFIQYLQTLRNASPHTIRSYVSDLLQFQEFLGNEGIQSSRDVTHLHIRSWLSSLMKQGTTRKSSARKVSSLRSFYRFLAIEEEGRENPADKVTLPKLEKRTPEFLYIEEVKHLMEAPSDQTNVGIRDRAILEFLYATGARVSELVSLDLKNLNLSLGTALLFGKGGKERIVLLGSQAIKWLGRYLEEVRPKYEASSNQMKNQALFLNQRGTRITDRSIRRMVDTYIKQVAAHLSISPHGLRHTFATHLLDEGADLRVVQELLGHVSLSSTQIYTHTTKEQLMRVYMNSHPRAQAGGKYNDAN